MLSSKTDEVKSYIDETLKKQVFNELEQEKQVAKQFNLEEIKNGHWFIQILRKVIENYNKNARAEYFQQKYPGLSDDELADKLILLNGRYASIAGAIAGVTATANQIATLSTSGMTIPLFLGTIGSEMLYLAKIQINLVLDLSVIYDLELNLDDPEDILMVFGYALGIAPADLCGKVVQKAAGFSTQGLIKKYISKGTLQAIQDFAKLIGIKILQRTIIKYAVPLASAAVGSSYNYMTTKTLGQIAKAHFKNRCRYSEELKLLVSRQNTYDIVIPAAILYLAKVDGNYSAEERDYYRAILSRMSFDSYTKNQFNKLLSKEENILSAIENIEDQEIKEVLLDLLILMACCDGKIAKEEKEFIQKVADRLNLSPDFIEIEKKASSYNTNISQGATKKVAALVDKTINDSMSLIESAAERSKEGFFLLASKIKEKADQILTKESKNCSFCGYSLTDDFDFCPRCGNRLATEGYPLNQR